MSSSFDPYREWLGIERGRRAANRYSILGLMPFEGERQEILAAAEAALTHVNRVARPEQSEIRDRVLAELQAAKRCLLDPDARAKYDAALRRHTRPSEASTNQKPSSSTQAKDPAPSIPKATPLPRAIPIGRPMKATPVSASPGGREDPDQTALSASLWDDADEIPSTLASSQQHSSWRTPLAIALGFLLAAAMLGFGGLALWQLQPGDDAALVAQQDVAHSDDALAENRSAEPHELASPQGQPTAAGAPHVDLETSSNKAATTSAEADPDDDTARQEADAVAKSADRSHPAAKQRASNAGSKSSPIEFTRALNRARGALVARNVELARRQLAGARKSAERPVDYELVNRIDLIAGHLGRFLAAVRAGVEKLDVADELNVDGEIVSVTEVGPDTLKLRMAGSQHDLTLSTMPAPLALMLARSVSDSNAAAVMLYLGAFHAVEPGGDRARARQLWQAAAAAGETVDDLMLLLDSDDLVIQREAIPGADVRKQADQRVAQAFAVTIRGARSAEQKAFLVRQLMTAAAEANDSADQYALLSEACARAALADDPARALMVADELARWFEVDALLLKAEALGKARTAARDEESARRVALAALALLDEAQPPDEVAKSLVLTAVGAARRSRDTELLEKATARRREIERAARESDRPTSDE